MRESPLGDAAARQDGHDLPKDTRVRLQKNEGGVTDGTLAEESRA